jgi:ferredoxin-fold anticodon binding domain-containing protein
MSEIKQDVTKEEKVDNEAVQEAITVSAEMLLAQIVSIIGEEFVVIPTGGWMSIVHTLQEYDSRDDKSESILTIMEGLGVPVIPVSLSPKKDEESRIITPNDMPKGESNIIMP